MLYIEIIKAYCTSMNKPKTEAMNFKGGCAIEKQEFGSYKSRIGMKINGAGLSLVGG